MNFLIDLQHPAHLHFFRHLILRLQEEGHQVTVTGRDKDILVRLAESFGMAVDVFGVARKGVFNLGKELIYRQHRLLKIIKKVKPDMMMAIAGTFISMLGKLKGIPTYIFYDTEHATISNLLAYPFSTCIYVPRCYRKSIRWNHVRYNGYHEIAYLHPRYFQPDSSVLEEVGVRPGEMFTIIRLVGWGAGHDIGLSGLSKENKLRVVRELEVFGKVFISCEGDLPEKLEEYRLRLDVTRIHDLMSYASLIFGESATMVSEGAVLGVPGIYIDPVGRGYTDEQEKEYGIVFNFNDKQQDEAIAKALSILGDYREKKWHDIGKQIIADKIDVTEMLYQIAMNTI